MKSWLDSYASGGTAAIGRYLKGDWDGYGVIIGGSAPLVGGTAT